MSNPYKGHNDYLCDDCLAVGAPRQLGSAAPAAAPPPQQEDRVPAARKSRRGHVSVSVSFSDESESDSRQSGNCESDSAVDYEADFNWAEEAQQTRTKKAKKKGEATSTSAETGATPAEPPGGPPPVSPPTSLVGRTAAFARRWHCRRQRAGATRPGS